MNWLGFVIALLFWLLIDIPFFILFARYRKDKK